MKKIQKINEDYYNKHAVDWTNRKTDSFYAEKEFRQFIKFLKKVTQWWILGVRTGLPYHYL